MDGTLLDDDKNFLPGMDELLDQMDARGRLRARVRARQVWTLIDMSRAPRHDRHRGNGGIVMRDGAEVSSNPSMPLNYARPSARARRPSVRMGIDGARSCGTPPSSAPMTASSTSVMPYYHRTKRVDDQIAIIDAPRPGKDRRDRQASGLRPRPG